MQIIGIALWVAGLLYAIGWGFIIRSKAKNEQATEHTFELHALLLLVSVILIPVLDLSPFHLLWMLPASFFIGLASMMFPLNLLWIPASIYGACWYIGTKNPGRTFYLAGDYENAIKCYKETILSTPQSAEAHFHLGLAYDNAGYKENAIESFKESIRLKPISHFAYFNLALCYKDLGNHEKAIETFNEVLLTKPDYDKARGNLGLVYVETGNIENALKEYEVLKKSNSEFADELYSVINAEKDEN